MNLFYRKHPVHSGHPSERGEFPFLEVVAGEA